MEMLDLSPSIKIRTTAIGTEGEPLAIVDNLLEHPEILQEYAENQARFQPDTGLYPGNRAPAPSAFQSALITAMGATIRSVFGLARREFRHVDSDFSIVSTPPSELELLQRIPHFDGTNRSELASIFYLCDSEFGGTSFYRHNSSGFEFVDDKRHRPYVSRLQQEVSTSPHCPSGYINGDTALFTRIGGCEAKFNRLVLYRGTSLHSGDIGSHYCFEEASPKGRLTIASFLHR